MDQENLARPMDSVPQEGASLRAADDSPGGSAQVSSAHEYRLLPSRSSILELFREAGPAWVLPALFFATLIIYGGFAWDRVGKPSTDNHFVYLADSYLHGTLEMRHPPPHRNDWASVDILKWEDGRELRGFWHDRRAREFRDLDRQVHELSARELRQAEVSRTYYISFPPFPAVVMMPGVWLRGFDFSDVNFTIFFAGLNVVLMHLFLALMRRRGYSTRTWKEDLILVAFFGLGSMHLWCSVLGQVWFTAHVVGVTCLLLYLIAGLDARYPLLAGLFLGCAFASRASMLFAAVYMAVVLLRRGDKWRVPDLKTIKIALIFGVFPLIIGGLLMWANLERFGHLTEFGHTFLSAGQTPRIRQYGLFHPVFINRNLAAMFALVPWWTEDMMFKIPRHGLALWFSMPVLFWIIKTKAAATSKEAYLRIAMWVTVAAIATPHILYHNTGWDQFSYRFAIDYLPCLVALLALSGRRFGALFIAALLWGIAVNSFGAFTFKRFSEWYINGYFPFS